MKGRPLFMVYRLVPGSQHVVRRLKQLAVLDGLPGLHCAVGSYGSSDALFPVEESALASRERLLHPIERLDGENAVFDRLTHYPHSYSWMMRQPYHVPLWCLHRSAHGQPRSDNFVGIVTAYDDTPRRGLQNARIWAPTRRVANVSLEKPRLFQRSLWAAIFYHTCCYAEGGGDQFILINAWNEWAEGMALEPSDLYGRAFLDELRETKAQFRRSCATPLRAAAAKQSPRTRTKKRSQVVQREQTHGNRRVRYRSFK